MKSTLKHGLLRVWVVASLLWFVAVLFYSSSDIGYIFKFYTQHDELVKSGMQFQNQARKGLEMERDTLIKEDKARLLAADELYRSYMKEHTSGLELVIERSKGVLSRPSDLDAALMASLDKANAQKGLIEVDKFAKEFAYGGKVLTPNPRIQEVELAIFTLKESGWVPSQPNWGWLLLSCTPPILFLVGGTCCFAVGKWIAHGFSSNHANPE